MPKNDFESLTTRALNLLSYRPQSIAEMKIKLKRSGADLVTINQLIDNFIDRGLLDDLEFAQWWVDQRVKFRPRGNYALTQELIQKGIDRNIIDSVLLSFDAELALAKKLPQPKRSSRGFSFSVIDALNAKE